MSEQLKSGFKQIRNDSPYNMKKRKYASKRWVFILLVFIMMATNAFVLDASREKRNYAEFEKQRILFISSYHSSFPTFSSQLKGLKDAMPEDKYLMDIEFMDSKRFYDEVNMSNFYARMDYKLSQLDPYDLVVVGDDNALQYAMDNQKRLFEGVPIIFLGINDLQRVEKAYSMGNITGVVESTSMKETLDLAMTLNPDADQVVIVVDRTPSGQGDLVQMLEFEDIYSQVVFKVDDLTELSYDELADRLHGYDDETILVMLSAYSDREGESMSFYESLDFIEHHSMIPIYHFYNHGIGSGMLGGVVVDHYLQGIRAGEMAKRILDGKDIQSIPPLSDKSVNRTIIDYEMMIEYGIDRDKLPVDVHFINKPVSFLDRNRELILTAVAVIAIMLITIVVMFLNIQRRKAVESSLHENNEELSALYEEMIAMNETLEASEEELRESYESLTRKNRIIEESKDRYKNVFDLSHSGMWEKNAQGEQVYVNSEWYMNLFEQVGKESVGEIEESKTLDLFYSHLDMVQKAKVIKLQSELLKGLLENYSLILSCCTDQENPTYIEEKAQAVIGEHGEISGIIGSHSDITASMVYEQQLEQFAYQDHLTGLPNRIVLERKLAKSFGDGVDEGTPGSVLLIDVDNFKFINNTYGHEVGDELLKMIADRLKGSISEDCFLGRVSGDEFIIICTGLHKSSDIELTAKKVLGFFEERFRLKDRSIYITVSIGIAKYPENGTALGVLLNRCNNAVYDAKKHGKNRYEIYDVALNEAMENRIYIQHNIREAIESDRFSMYYQPLYSLKQKRIHGFEALIRWKDDVKGFIPPSEFIVVAEQMGLIGKLGDWVFRKSARFIKQMRHTHEMDFYVSINVSPVQLMQNDFVETVSHIIDNFGIPYEAVSVEITETALMQSLDKNTEKLNILRKKGVRICLDDFGTGYSSLNYLRKLPVDVLKIDKSFINEVSSSPHDKELTGGIILLAQKIGLDVLVEGVETAEQFRYLKASNCDAIQGYLISRPLPEADIKEFYEGFMDVEL